MRATDLRRLRAFRPAMTELEFAPLTFRLLGLYSAYLARPRASSRDVSAAERGAAPARGIRNLAPGTPRVTVRPHYEGLPSMAGLGRAKAAKASGSGPRRAVRPGAGSTVPRREIAAGGAPRGGRPSRTSLRSPRKQVRHWARTPSRRFAQVRVNLSVRREV